MNDDNKFGILPYPYDEKLLASALKDSSPRLQVYLFPETAIVLGRGSNPEVELKLEESLKDQITLYRRRGGGCSVVLDPGNVVVSVILPIPGISENKKWFQRCTDWMIDGLEKVGIAGAYQDGVSDLVISNRKIAGSALYRMKGILYYSVSLLVTPDISLMENYLQHPPREPEYRKKRTHSTFVTSLAETHGITDIRDFRDRLLETLRIETLFTDSE